MDVEKFINWQQRIDAAITAEKSTIEVAAVKPNAPGMIEVAFAPNAISELPAFCGVFDSVGLPEGHAITKGHFLDAAYIFAGQMIDMHGLDHVQSKNALALLQEGLEIAGVNKRLINAEINRVSSPASKRGSGGAGASASLF